LSNSVLTLNRVFDPPEDNPVQRFSRAVLPQGKRVKDQTFGFDRVFDENTTQADVYEATTRSLLDSVLDGFNATVFAYGATGCGKTHTITGTAQQPGIIFMTMQELFEKVEELKETKEVEVSLSYLEIYNENIRDLLNPDMATAKQGLMLREDSNQAVSVAGLSSHKPHNVQEVMDMVIQGNAQRTQSPTAANATSSRSHAVLQVNVSSKDRNTDVNEPVTFATLSIIDLAGSERASATKNRGARLLEGANINKSLLALGSCINALCDSRKHNHIPYRNSKLTRLLKFSLGGNCRTVMIVCISPSSQHFDETQNTLRYANRAKNIQTKSVRNVYNVDRHVKDYLKKIDEQMARINELTAQQKQFEELAFVKFRKSEVKRQEIAQDGMQRIRAAFEHSLAERNERTQNTRRLRHTERRIGAISGWIGAFDQVCETREDEEPSAALTSMRKTATGILVELEGSRQHYHQRLAKNNWTRAIDTALQDGLRQLQNVDGATANSAKEMSLRKEVELLKNRADIEMHLAVLEQDKTGDAGLMQVMLSAHFETIAILNQITQMTQEEAMAAGRSVLGKLLQSCTEATGQVIKPDGGLQITEAMPPTKSGTPRKKKQVPLMGPSPLKNKIRTSLLSNVAPASAIPPRVAAEMHSTSSSPQLGPSPAAHGATASPRRRLKPGGSARSRVMFPTSGTPKRKSPVKKRAVKWKDEDVDGGSLVEFQPTPKPIDSSPPDVMTDSENNPPPPQFSTDIEDSDTFDSSPLPNLPPSKSSTANGRFATGFLAAKKSPDHMNSSSPTSTAPTLNASFSSESETSPLREIEPNRAPHSKTLSHRPKSPSDTGDTSDSGDGSATGSMDKETAQALRSALLQNKKKRSSSLGGSAALAQRRESSATNSTASAAHRRRSPTAATSPTSDTGSAQGIFSASHARRMVNKAGEDAGRSVLSPAGTRGVGKSSVAARRSMFDMHGSARESVGGAGIVGRGAAVRNSVVGTTSGGSKAAWR
jgi:kinesin family protein 18/19